MSDNFVFDELLNEVVTLSATLPSRPDLVQHTTILKNDLVEVLNRALNTWPDAPLEMFELQAALTISDPVLLQSTLTNLQAMHRK